MTFEERVTARLAASKEPESLDFIAGELTAIGASLRHVGRPLESKEVLRIAEKLSRISRKHWGMEGENDEPATNPRALH